MSPSTQSGIELAIKKAIEGGYGKDNAYAQIGGGVAICFPGTDRIDTYISNDTLFLDPEFWRCLGKAEGWEEYQDIDTTEYGFLHYANGTIFGWQAVWHRFIDHLASGKDADSFFDALLTN